MRHERVPEGDEAVPEGVQPAFKAANIRKKGALDDRALSDGHGRDPAYAKAEYGLGLVLRQKEDYPGAKKALIRLQARCEVLVQVLLQDQG